MANPKAEGSPVIDGTFGAPLYSGVIQLIEAREKMFGKENKTPDELRAIHSNTPWVMFRSGADILTDFGKAAKRNKDVSKLVSKLPILQNKASDNTKAKSCIFYGMLGNTEGPHAPYYWSKTLGARPVAGITGVDVDCKDQYGAVLEATINLKVFSREALNDIDALYFKPGMPALLEFGHSVYVDKDGTVKNFDKVNDTLSDDIFFKSGEVFATIADDVRRLRVKNLNYEALFGYITNFSWSLQKDGSYDCSVKMLSSGTVLKGLQLGETSRFFKAEESHKEEDDESILPTTLLLTAVEEANMVDAPPCSFIPGYGAFKGIQNDINTLRGVLNQFTPIQKADLSKNPTQAIRQYPGVEKKKNQGGNSKRLPLKASVSQLKLGTQYFEDNFREIQCISIKTTFNCGLVRWFKSSKDYTLQYITLRDALYILEFFNVSKHTTGDGLIHFNKLAPYRYVNVPGTFSLRPTLAAKPYMPISGVTNEFAVAGLSETTLDIEKTVFDSHPGRHNRILNIWISLEEFVAIVKSVVEGNKDNYTILEVVETLLAEIQKAFGNINDFRLYRNHVMNVWEIVDYNHIDAGGMIPEIRITGTKNTVKEFDIHSDVSDDLANQMSVAAQASAKEGTTGATAQELVHWNENSVARFTWPKEDKGDDEVKKAEDKAKEEQDSQFWKSVERLYKAMNGNGGWQSSGDSSDTAEQRGETVYEEIQAHGCQYFQQLVNSEYIKAQKGENGGCKGEMQNGIIPFKTSLTLKGLGGMVIGTTFKMNQNILPEKYSNWGNIVTGIKHKVDSSGWWTTVDTCYWPYNVVAGTTDRDSANSLYKVDFSYELGEYKSATEWRKEEKQKKENAAAGGAGSDLAADDGTVGEMITEDSQLAGKTVIIVAHATGAGSHRDPGDQVGDEVHLERKSFAALPYKSASHKGWQFVYRFKDPEVARKAAIVASNACKDDTIGYHTPSKQRQDYNMTRRETFAKRDALPNSPLPKGTNVETDCSAFVHTCYMIADPTHFGPVKLVKGAIDPHPSGTGAHYVQKYIKEYGKPFPEWYPNLFDRIPLSSSSTKVSGTINSLQQLRQGDILWKFHDNREGAVHGHGHGAMVVDFK